MVRRATLSPWGSEPSLATRTRNPRPAEGTLLPSCADRFGNRRFSPFRGPFCLFWLETRNTGRETVQRTHTRLGR